MPVLARTAVAALLAALLGGCSLANSLGATAPAGITILLFIGFTRSDVDKRSN